MIGASSVALTRSLPSHLAAATAPKIQVFKTPTRGCCKMWVDHLAAGSFEVEDLADLTSIKQMAPVPDHLLSCRTGMIEGYTIEGHITSKTIKKLLAERPKSNSLAVPGMPAGFAGMPSPPPRALVH